MKENIFYADIEITDGFWKRWQDINRRVTVPAIYDRLVDTERIKSLLCDWKEGMPQKPHIFWESDIEKWMEAAAYLTKLSPEPELEKLIDEIVDLIEKNQGEDGYFNVYYTVVEPNNRFKRRGAHELYCAGTLMEAGVAYKQATGKDKLYNCALRYADYIYKVFVEEKSAAFKTPGHQEIELALVRLYKESGNKKYLELAKHFLDERGSEEERPLIIPPRLLTWSYAQDELPVRQQREIKGHAVRAFYMLCGMADVAAEYPEDIELREACEKLFEDAYYRKMYVTGGFGSNIINEGFDERFYLPNEMAYNETCASVSMIFFASRMQRLFDSSVYADAIERELYNGMLSGISNEGNAFFYENPLEIDLDTDVRQNVGDRKTITVPTRSRVAVFETFCCPPNVARLIASMGKLVYSGEGDKIYVNQYIASKASFLGRELVQTTTYPSNGKISLRFGGKNAEVGMRIPGWCDIYTISVNGKPANGTEKNGYLWLQLSNGDEVTLHLDMSVKFVEANPRVAENAGRVAVMRGPVVYCLESVDNGGGVVKLRDYRISAIAKVEEVEGNNGIPFLNIPGIKRVADPNQNFLYSNQGFKREDTVLHFIPYHYFANRGVSNMLVWVLEK